jgi:hypothetical protein
MQIGQKIFKTIFYNFKPYVFGACFASILKITADRAKFYRVLFVEHKKQFQRLYCSFPVKTVPRNIPISSDRRFAPGWQKNSRKNHSLCTTKKCSVSLNGYLCTKAKKCIFFMRV